jgi:hyperosmotically inducible protein
MEMKSRTLGFVFLVSAAALGLLAFSGVTPLEATQDKSQSNPIVDTYRLATAVRHELVILPFYDVFDNLQFQLLSDGTVELSGEVTRPILKSDAESVVRNISGVNKVVNNIEVLPLSPFDNGIRRAVYRAIFSNPVLDRYWLRAVSPIHIIVKNGEVTLVGVVATQAEKNVAGIVTNGVPGIFRVTNDLRVENASPAPAGSPGARPTTIS